MKKWIGLAMIGIMFFSLPAYAFFQGSFNSQPQSGGEQAELPQDYVIDYSMSQAQFQNAVERGLTVATYRYSGDCAECPAEISLLESIVRSQEFNGQIILEELRDSGSPRLQMVSFAGERSLDSVDQQSVFSALCDLVVSPPLSCVSG